MNKLNELAGATGISNRATTITVSAAIVVGAASRPMAAQASEPIATSNSSELANAARIDARFQP